MPRRYLRRLSAEFRENKALAPWYLRPFQAVLRHPAYLAVNRRSIAAGMGIGLFIGMLPIPGHTPLAIFAALFARANLAVSVLAIWVANPLTWGPLYYGEYRLGSWLLQQPAHQLANLELRSMMESLSGIWKPLFVGGVMLALVSGVLGWLLTHVVWQWSVALKYRRRGQRITAPRKS
jgi:uncharacterized protein